MFEDRVVAGEDDTFVAVNLRHCEVFGLEFDELLGRSIADVTASE